MLNHDWIIELMFLKLLLLIRQLDKGTGFQSSVCNGCQGVLMMSTDINSIIISNIHGVNYPCIIFGIRKKDAINSFAKFLFEVCRDVWYFVLSCICKKNYFFFWVNIFLFEEIISSSRWIQDFSRPPKF